MLSARSRGTIQLAAKISARNQPEAINRASWTPFVVDDEWRSAYKHAQTITNGGETDNLLRQCRLHSTMQMADYSAKLPAGDMIECGCCNGHSTVAIATILAQHGFAGRFHVFDSFEGGLSAFTAKDESAFKLSEQEKREIRQKFVSSHDFAQSVTGKFGFVELHRGWIPDVFKSFQLTPLRYVHVDVDLYEPTLASLEFFWDSLVDGGCIVIDDYNYGPFEGATRAVDEFVRGRRMRQFYKVPLGSCYLVK